ncbi:MAG: hypothetical protein KIT31_21250 [Deltaproteobacteria bacterium]|nr:hypothetical protein [Deltaproteobacteria bacterium]
MRTAPRSNDLPLADLVRRAVELVPDSGRFGDKVFISEVYKQFARLDAVSGDHLPLPEHGFRAWLLEGMQLGLVVLLRADLAPVMDQEMVAASVIEDRGATFHFVKA